MTGDGVERRLAAIMSADVAGYSRLMGKDETGTLAALKALRKDVFAPQVAAHKGRVVKLMGDGALVEFPSIVNAVNCAIAVQRALGKRASGEQIELRIGINLGDIIIEGSDIYGDGVNVAARIQEVAEPGGVALSAVAHDQVAGKVEAAFEDTGEHKLKNIDKPVRVYRWIDAAADPPPGTAGAEGALPLPDKPSIAVLPFVNMSGDPEQEYFSDGITEDIITELSRFRTLFVIARNSSFAYKGKAVDVKQIARELGVRYVLEGSIRRAGGQVRVTAQLIDCESGRHVWAERYDRELEGIFALQEEITGNVVGSIAPQIEMAEMARILGSRDSNVSAYDLALKAQALLYDALRMGSPEIHQQALDTAAVALKHDPRSINALWVQAMALADAYLYRWGPAPDEALNQAWEVVDQLIDVDSSEPRAYTMRGFVQHFRGEHEAAVADFRYAFALNPNFAINIFLMAWSESLAGLTVEAREHAALGLRLSPRDNEIWLGTAYLALAQASFADGDFEETEKWAKLAVQMHPRAPIRRAIMIACCVHKGELKKAREHADFLKSFAPDFISSILDGDLTLYRMPKHNALLTDGLCKAGSTE